MSVKIESFEETCGRRQVQRIRLDNGAMQAQILTYGAVLQSLTVKDRRGNAVDVVLGYPHVADYENNKGCMGATIGRYTNRIYGPHCLIDGIKTPLTPNKPGQDRQNHGGPDGFARRVFHIGGVGENEATLELSDPDGNNGFPGRLSAEVRYALEANALHITYKACTDKATYCCMTNHSYFNLDCSEDILAHELLIHSDLFTPVDENLIPISYGASVSGTPFDFRQRKRIGTDIRSGHPQVKLVSGYDHNFILQNGNSLRPAAELTSEKSGIRMELLTNKPAIQVYTANTLRTGCSKVRGKTYGRYAGICLEPQFVPDMPNHPEWGNILLRPDEKYCYESVYRFSVSD